MNERRGAGVSVAPHEMDIEMFKQPATSPPSRRRSGFTLTEMLVVIGIITILVAIAVPSFKAMSGGRSLDAAANNVSSALSRARAEAIGTGRTAGILFYTDPGTDRVGALLVREQVTAGLSLTRAAEQVVQLEMTPEGEYILLPTGVGLQVIISGFMEGTPLVRKADGYFGYNVVTQFTNTGAKSATPLAGANCGGAILFDGSGRLLMKSFTFALKDGANNPSQLTITLSGNPNITVPNTIMSGSPTATLGSAESGVGFILFDLQEYRSQAWTNGAPVDNATLAADPKSKPPTNYQTSSEVGEEAWLDGHSIPYLVNRYNGTLIKAE